MLEKLFAQLEKLEIPGTKIQAQSIAHTLSNPAKMPGKSYGLPAGSSCNVGGKLRSVAGSVCADCYACKGCYSWQSTKTAQQIRLDAIQDQEWPAGMIKLIGNKPGSHFRWHDSGDIQSFLHFLKIIFICKKTPHVKHWLPTKEKALIFKFVSLYGAEKVPPNLCIRISSPMVDQGPLKVPGGINTSTVHYKDKPHGKQCRAPFNNGKCGNCRMCWNNDIPNISYCKH